MCKSAMKLISRTKSARVLGMALMACLWMPDGVLAQSITSAARGSDGSPGSSVVTSGTVVINGQVVSEGSADQVRGSGPVKEKSIALPPFTKLRLDAPIEVSFVQGPQTAIKISAQENILPQVLASVRSGRLTVSLEGAISTTQPITATVTAPSLAELVLHGSGGVSASGVTGKALAIELSGSGDVKLDGQVEQLQIRIAGSGDVDVERLKAKSLDVKVSGSGNVTGYASDAASVVVNGSGDVLVLGDPKRRTAHRHGSGEIRFVGR